jgi:RimJ/RimL family protein N-acetyltransferase
VVESTLSLQLLTPADWSLLRAARLKALLDSPHAFTSSHINESGWREPEWRQQLDTGTWIIARKAEEVIGLARSTAEPGCPATRNVDSIWVAPLHRGRGVCRTLLQALTEMGVTELLLWVLEQNQDAQRAYDALGFEPTGESQFLPEFRQSELRLRRRSGDLTESGAIASFTGRQQRRSKPDLDRGRDVQEVQGLSSVTDGVNAAAEPMPVG